MLIVGTIAAAHIDGTQRSGKNVIGRTSRPQGAANCCAELKGSRWFGWVKGLGRVTHPITSYVGVTIRVYALPSQLGMRWSRHSSRVPEPLLGVFNESLCEQPWCMANGTANINHARGPGPTSLVLISENLP